MALVLTTAMLVVYFTFILLIAFDKSLLGRMITDGLSLGILLGVFVVLATWVLTWTYVAWVNRRYEPAAREIRERAAMTAPSQPSAIRLRSPSSSSAFSSSLRS